MAQERVLIVEDEENERTGLAELVSSWGYRTETASDGVEAMEKMSTYAPSIVITDIKMPRMGGLELAERLADLSTPVAVVMVTAQKTTDTAFHAGRLGVQDYIEKPIDFRRLRSILTNIGEILNARTENESLRRRLRDKGALGLLVGSSTPMQEIFRLIEMVAPSTASVLITGASGTGKELVARTIHDLSPRRNKPFVPINCAAIPETLIESEIFVLLREPSNDGRDVSNWQKAAPCCSMRLAKCRWRLRPSYCVSLKTASCVAWEAR
jgi:DNA-binding NtrC family response regulator